LKEILADDSGQASSIRIPDQVESLGDETGQDIDKQWIFSENFKEIIACPVGCFGIQINQ
jgi:hypothetical protein